MGVRSLHEWIMVAFWRVVAKSIKTNQGRIADVRKMLDGEWFAPRRPVTATVGAFTWRHGGSTRLARAGRSGTTQGAAETAKRRFTRRCPRTVDQGQCPLRCRR